MSPYSPYPDASPPRLPPAPARLASAVVLARSRVAGGIEVLMVRRHAQSDFAPDVYVFPGGSVKPGDREAEATPGLCAPAGSGTTALGSGLRVAALRELFEEAGVLLAYRRDVPLVIEPRDAARIAASRAELSAGRATLGSIAAREGLRLATDALLPWAHWITPEAFPKRFDTYFFLTEAPREQVATHDEIEVTASVWVSPEDALAGYARGEFPLVFATVRQLSALAGLPDVAAAQGRFGGRTPETIMPVATPTPDGGFVVQIPGAPEEPERF
jgi:8-oxo-dGTP pyrophosphatase MutT (NUDIX family)